MSVLHFREIFPQRKQPRVQYMYIYNERLIQEFHMILTVAATSMYLILKSVGLAIVHILFISKFWKLILIGFVLGFTMVPMMEHELI